ncbi:3-dehydroquinate synthase [bacterium]|nr:MAG: 3-dehydroquinate synthase [bacterium]
MKIIKVSLKKRSYEIVIGSQTLRLLGKYIKKLNLGSDAYVITNAAIKMRHGRLLSSALKEAGFSVKFKLVADSEKSKSIETAAAIIQDLTLYDKKRKIFIVAFGGGVIGDLAGFVASIYKRGIPYIQVPTTLLAQVDSSIGGKTAVDLAEAKNMVGAFYQPRLVLSDVGLLETLGLRQIRAGLAEVIKYGLIKDKRLFNYLEKNYPKIIRLEQGALEFVVWRSSYIKARIVEQDEKEERGLRTILNFGHTLGHAIESAGLYRRYNHGEAVAIGMVLACAISRRLRLTDEATCTKIEGLIKAVGLPVRIKNICPDKIISAHYRDKKFIGPKNRFVLLKNIGRAAVRENIPLPVIKAVLKERI